LDPRNPLGRLDELSRRPAVRRLTLEFIGSGDGEVERGVVLELTDGRKSEFVLRVGTSWIDLLDAIQTFVESFGRVRARPMLRMQSRRRGPKVSGRPSEVLGRAESTSIGGET